jgi:uncharacterized membrane protein YkoI
LQNWCMQQMRACARHEQAAYTITLFKEVRMKQLLGMMAVAIGVMLVLNGPAWSDQKGKGKKDEAKEMVEMAATAKVTIDEAIKTASEKVPGKVVEAELEKKHNTLVWEVEVVTAENKVMEVHIDAGSGAVISVEEEKPETDMKSEKKRERKQQHKP